MENTKAAMWPIGRMKTAKVRFTTKRVVWLWAIFFVVDFFCSLFINADIFTLACWIGFVVYTVFFHTRFVVKYFVFYYEYITHIIGVFVIENGNVYLGEIGRYSLRYNSLFLITVVHWLFLVLLLLIDPSIERRLLNKTPHRRLLFAKKDISLIAIKIGGLLFFGIISYLLLNVIRRPAFLMGIDRTIYTRDVINASPTWSLFHSMILYLVPITLFLACNGFKKFGYILLAMYSAYMFLVGNKFGTYLTVLFMFVPLILDRFNLYNLNKKRIFKILLISFLVGTGFLLLLFIFNRITYGRDLESFIAYLNRRISQQGQLWWAVFGREKYTGLRLKEIGDEFGAFFEINKTVISERRYGIYKIMQLVTPRVIYAHKIASNGRYAFSTDASFYYYFKEGMILFVPLGAWLVSLSVNWLYKAVRMRDLVHLIVAARFQMIVLQVMVQSDFYKIFSKSFAVLLIICLVWDRLFYHYRERSFSQKRFTDGVLERGK